MKKPKRITPCRSGERADADPVIRTRIVRALSRRIHECQARDGFVLATQVRRIVMDAMQETQAMPAPRPRRRPGRPPNTSKLDKLDRAIILECLREHPPEKGGVRVAAFKLGVGRTTLFRFIRKHPELDPHRSTRFEMSAKLLKPGMSPGRWPKQKERQAKAAAPSLFREAG